MASGFFALLDDISALVKVSAASLDDVPAQVAKTTGKVSGIVIDDTAVTPKYVVGLDPSRELSIIYKIAKKSLVNKLLILSPAALLLGYFAPWAITPVLMLGGAYLCFEGYEKVHQMFSKHPELEPESETIQQITPEELEKERVTGAVRTDIILSAEIMAIAYSQVTGQPILKNDLMLLDFLAKNKFNPVVQKFGRGLVKAMPHFLSLLSYVGTAAMLWVGAEIIAHGIPFTSHLLHNLEEALAHIPVVAWLAKALSCAIGGLVVGFVVEKIVLLVKKAFAKKKSIPPAQSV